MSIPSITRAASSIAAATSARSTRAESSYGAVAASAARAKPAAAALASSVAKPAAALPGFAGGFPPTQGVPPAATPKRPQGVPGDYVYRNEMWLPPAAAAIYDAQVADAQQKSDQFAFWQGSTNPAQIEGYPLEQWSTAQLKAGLDFYNTQLANAVPQSNEWLQLTDRINSIQANLDGNRSPWNYALSGSVDYWGTIGHR